MPATGYLSSAYRLYTAFVRVNARSHRNGLPLCTEPADLMRPRTLPSNAANGPVSSDSSASGTPDSSAALRTFNEGSLGSGFHSSGHRAYESSCSSPPTRNVPNVIKFEELDISVIFNAFSLRQNAYEQMRAAGGRHRLLHEMEADELGSDELSMALSTATVAEKGILLFWAAYLGRVTLLSLLLEQGADPNYHDSFGLSPLDIAAFKGSTECVSLLLARGADPNFAPRCFTPLHCAAFGNFVEVARILISHGASVHEAERISSGDNGLLQCAVRAGSVGCLELFISNGVDVNSIEPGGINAIHLAADLGMARCLNVLLATPGADPNVRIRVGNRKSTALHLAADGGSKECIDLLLERGADASLEDHRGFTALHLAARVGCLGCIEPLLCRGKANPNAMDFDKRTPLHAAVGKTDSTCDIIEMLIKWGANVHQKDEYGFTPLHLAALDGLSHCVETLIVHGADVTTRCNTGTSALNAIARKTPASLAVITRKLDCAITLHHSQCSSREVVLKLDFRNILRHYYPHEIGYLNAFVDEDQKEFLLHPLFSAFIYIKWEKIRKYYIARLAFCFIFMLCLTLYVLTAFTHNSYSNNNHINEIIEKLDLSQKKTILGDSIQKVSFAIKTQWWTLAAITILEIFRKVYCIAGYSTVKQYFVQSENIVEWFVIVSVFLTSYVYTDRTYTWQNHVGAFAVLAGWTNLTLKLGRLPVFGTYVAMYQKVQKEFVKLLMAFSCILVGFTVSFCVAFPNSPLFRNSLVGFVTVLTIMGGDLHHHLLWENDNNENPHIFLQFSAEIIYVLVLISVSVILTNLLVGIAVNDIQGLTKTAGLSKLVRQTKLISNLELALFKGYLPKSLIKYLYSTILVSPQAYWAVLSVKPLDPNEKRLPQDLMMTAYEVAKVCEEYGYTNFSKESARHMLALNVTRAKPWPKARRVDGTQKVWLPQRLKT